MGVVLSDVISITILVGIGVMCAVAAARIKDDPEQARILTGVAATIAFATAILIIVLSVMFL